MRLLVSALGLDSLRGTRPPLLASAPTAALTWLRNIAARSTQREAGHDGLGKTNASEYGRDAHTCMICIVRYE